jgi:hypothetical protein
MKSSIKSIVSNKIAQELKSFNLKTDSLDRFCQEWAIILNVDVTWSIDYINYMDAYSVTISVDGEATNSLPITLSQKVRLEMDMQYDNTSIPCGMDIFILTAFKKEVNPLPVIRKMYPHLTFTFQKTEEGKNEIRINGKTYLIF